MGVVKKLELLARGLTGLVVGLLSADGFCQTPAAAVSMDRQGTVLTPIFAIPPSAYLDRRSQEAVIEGFLHGAPLPGAPWSELSKPGPAIENWRRALDEFMRGQVAHLRTLYAVDIQSKEIGGVRTDIVVPTAGIAAVNQNRVLINLHGGGYLVGGRFGGQGESIPVAGLARIKVVAVDYRMAPEHRFPAASIDVASVYRELLKDYRPENIGIYGCSAGGRLAAQTVAWLQQENLPKPGAIGILCGSAGVAVDGDSNYTAPLLNGRLPPAPGVSVLPPSPYFAGVDIHDPMASPDASPAVLARFPPTLFVTATRDMEMSAALHSHNALIKAGVDAELHVWDGLGHGFFNLYPEIQESRDALDVIVKFFDKHLGTAARNPG